MSVQVRGLSWTDYARPELLGRSVIARAVAHEWPLEYSQDLRDDTDKYAHVLVGCKNLSSYIDNVLTESRTLLGASSGRHAHLEPKTKSKATSGGKKKKVKERWPL